MEAKQVVTTWQTCGGRTDTRILQPEPDISAREGQLLNLYPEVGYQKLGTFGGAITDAAAATLEQMPEEKAQEIMEAYFGKNGIGYRAIRTHIDSCDFSTGQYSAVTDPEDTRLQSFSLSRDDARVIRWIQRAYQAAGEAIPVVLAPWSPLPFMKTNGSRIHGGHLKKECYEVWAKYLCRYVQEYLARGIRVTALSVQNEPNAVQTWDSCLYTPEEERVFLSRYLYPEFQRQGLSQIRFLIWDHNKERLYDRAKAVLTEETEPLVSGLAFHWYTGDHFDALRIVRERYPEKQLIFSEGCVEYSRFDQNQLRNAQIYGHDMLGNLRAGMNGFFDWNICLNMQGGPNYAGNYCEAPILCDTARGEVDYKLSFAYIGHFSRFLQPGAQHIGTTVYTESIEQVAFQNPDGSIAVVLLNRTDAALPVVLRMNGMLIPADLPPQSISTIIIS